MNGKHQVSRTVEVAADPSAIWGIIADSALLPQWAGVVKDVTYLGEAQEGVGMTRHCNVELGGRTGTMTERCVEFVPDRRASYVVDDDTLGFNRMLRDYGFTITLEPRSERTTALRIDTYYTPRNPLYALLNRLLLKQRMRKVVDGLLQGLKQISERRGVPAA
jgi:uncharacterized protein YndB with AHSA1/START domain